MVSVTEALALVRGSRWDGGHEQCLLSSAVERVLSEDVRSTFLVPRFANSAMDGFALGSLEGPWSIVGGVQAGDSGNASLCPGQAAKITTGARLPDGSVAVLPREDAELSSLSNELHSPGRVSEGAHIRREGEELEVGDLMIPAGTQLDPIHLSVLASAGLPQVNVRRMPTVTLLATGNELVAPGTTLSGSAVYESNSWGLRADLSALGCAVGSETVRDDLEGTKQALQRAVDSSDLVLTIGGVSVGEFDYVKAAVESLAGEKHFEKVSMKPGKPITFATFPNGTRWFGLPGNPMSTWVTYLLFVREWLGLPLRREVGILANDYSRSAGRDEFVPMLWNAPGKVNLLTTVGSHATAALVSAHGLVQIPGECEHLPAGSQVQVLRLPGGSR
ncbi:MAG TPA: molybdopterin molybdotransferase MoeA [Fimbriimonadaceae bacterium]|nr:molybdopterin molybdotransferase MoeA [Fimbriimonadaceae bacterium]